MTFNIIKTSDPFGTEQPCAGAFMVGFDYVEPGYEQKRDWVIEIHGLCDLDRIMKENKCSLVMDGRNISLVR